MYLTFLRSFTLNTNIIYRYPAFSVTDMFNLIQLYIFLHKISRHAILYLRKYIARRQGGKELLCQSRQKLKPGSWSFFRV